MQNVHHAGTLQAGPGPSAPVTDCWLICCISFRPAHAAYAGGANLPALNELLAPYGMAFGDAVLEGPVQLGGEKLHYASGANIVKFPAGGYLHAATLPDKAVAGATQAALPSIACCCTADGSLISP